MTQPSWQEIILEMLPEDQQEVRRIADKMTEYFMTDRLICDDYPGQPNRRIVFRKYKPFKEVVP